MPTEPDSGFTLLEVLIVLVIIGLATAIVALRGPSHSPALDLRATAQSIAETLRLARSQAIAGDRPVTVAFDVAAHTVRLGAAPPQALPIAIALAVTAPAIRFEPDGSATGGTVALADAGRRTAIGVDWLLGRVTIVHGP